MPDRDPLTVPCPSCRALPGRPCRAQWGAARKYPHAERYDAAREKEA